MPKATSQARAELILQAPAKINPFLNLRALQDDGYHTMASVMQTIALSDTLHFSTEETSKNNPNRPSLTISTDSPALERTLHNENKSNIIESTYLEFFKVVKQPYIKLHIHLEKRIPFQAGLGGGSSDAASTLLALNTLTEQPLTMNELETLSATLGCDVPFFIQGGTALATGRGEIIQSLSRQEAFTPWPIVIIKPKDLSIPTPHAYQLIREAKQYQTQNPQTLIDALRQPASTQNLIELQQHLYNDFQTVLSTHYPAFNSMSKIFQTVLTTLLNTSVEPFTHAPQLQLLPLLLCGSGAAMVGFLPPNQSEANTHTILQQHFPTHTYDYWLTQTTPNTST